jgi:hypothetical protein
MADGTTLLIGPAHLAETLQHRPEFSGTQLLVFAEEQVREAVEAIVHRMPSVVAVRDTFAQTPRGTALTNRVTMDAHLSATRVCVIGPDGGVSALQPPTPPTWLPLDTAGTRRAARVRIRPGVPIQIDGAAAELVDLSTLGAQVVSHTVLKPSQRVRVILPVERETTRAVGTVIWANFELSKTRPEPLYRAGLEFSLAETEPLLRICLLQADDSAATLED